MITGEMKISEVLRKYPHTLEVFVKVSPHFKKLENKFLRKALAGRVNVNQAANIAGINSEELLIELNRAINKEIDMSKYFENKEHIELQTESKPEELIHITDDKIIQFDVRPILEQGRDPFNDIMSKIKDLKSDEMLMIINSFEPVPLYSVLGNKGFQHWTEKENDVFKVYFFKAKKETHTQQNNFDAKLSGELKTEKIIELDVRELPPPEPMMKILEKLNEIDENTILLVHHHREPLMLYPKLEERGFQAITYKINPDYFKVIISKISRDS